MKKETKNKVVLRMRKIFCLAGSKFSSNELQQGWEEIERLESKLENLADGLDKFLAEKGSAMSTRAIAKAWINGQYDK